MGLLVSLRKPSLLLLEFAIKALIVWLLEGLWAWGDNLLAQVVQVMNTKSDQVNFNASQFELEIERGKLKEDMQKECIADSKGTSKLVEKISKMCLPKR